METWPNIPAILILLNPLILALLIAWCRVEYKEVDFMSAISWSVKVDELALIYVSPNRSIFLVSIRNILSGSVDFKLYFLNREINSVMASDWPSFMPVNRISLDSPFALPFVCFALLIDNAGILLAVE